jgi:hypothetical protein
MIIRLPLNFVGSKIVGHRRPVTESGSFYILGRVCQKLWIADSRQDGVLYLHIYYPQIIV